MSTFAAIDFETADNGRDSACSVGIVLVKERCITEKIHRLIRPPRKEFVFTYIHGLTWSDVRNSPTFRQLWPELKGILSGADFLVAHNASFDKSVLKACCESAETSPPAHEFLCTMEMARDNLNLSKAALPNVCRHLGIPLNHHDALSDAEACARIAIELLP